MNDKTLRKANELQHGIDDLKNFIYYCQGNRNIRFYKKKTFIATVSDYMRETKLFELSPKLREKFIELLKLELLEMEREFAAIRCE